VLSNLKVFSPPVDVQIDRDAPRVLNCVFSDQGQVFQRWDYSEHEPLLGVWLPGHMTFTTYLTTHQGLTHSAPNIRYTYDLVSAAPSSVPDNDFTPEGVVPDGSVVVLPGARSPGRFNYDKSSGETFMRQYIWERGPQ
jgi:hypothetical protein